jgi:hypothetical protein
VGGCTVGPTLGACDVDGADVVGMRVVADCGDLVGYLRTLEVAAFPAFDAELPMSAIGACRGADVVLRDSGCMVNFSVGAGERHLCRSRGLNRWHKQS